MDDWVLGRPDDVRAVHAAFVEAGAEVLLAGTFRALPGVSDRWEAVADAAVALAREASAGRAEVWASVGPAPPGAVAALVRRVEVDGIVLETWTDPEACADAVAAVRRAWDGPLVASLVPRARPDVALRRLVRAGADGVGFNCGLDPEEVLRAVEATTLAAPLWAKPAGGAHAATVDALRRLAARCRWVGGCCGVGPDVLREARRRGPAG